ncbi:MAG: hypothetical protein KA385_00975 [Vicinamibacteria bacterium]|nr:hypothetical protein [Vicinamibacteria bacterium]
MQGDPFHDHANWRAFDLEQLGPGVGGYAESIFDGRYVYYGPERNYDASGRSAEAHANFLRYDTSLPFEDCAAWEVFNAARITGVEGGSVGMAFDGRFVYYAPFRSGKTGEYNLFSVALRYDTHRPFGSEAAWTPFDMRVMHPSCGGYVGAEFDGRYFYCCPYYSDRRSVFARYDTHGEFANPDSWVTIDKLSFTRKFKGYIGARHVAGHVYFSPCYNDLLKRPHGLMLRVRCDADFRAKASWESFDLETVDRSLVGYDGMASDGRYVYYAPYYPRTGLEKGLRHGRVARFDTTRSFRDPAAWQAFDAERVFGPAATGYIGAGFDGAHIYFAPVGNHVGYHGNVLRFDTRRPFAEDASWALMNVAEHDDRRVYYDGAVACDGRSMYFVACGAGRKMLQYRLRD